MQTSQHNNNKLRKQHRVHARQCERDKSLPKAAKRYRFTAFWLRYNLSTGDRVKTKNEQQEQDKQEKKT